VAAYAVVRGLAGAELLGFGVPPIKAKVSAVSIETDEPVDDVAIEFASGWRATVQARRALRKGKAIDSAIDQWRKAALAGIDPEREQLILVTAAMPGWIQSLKTVLDRSKTDRPGTATQSEETALEYLTSRLSNLKASQQETVLRAASIRLLLVEEEAAPHSGEAIRLLDDVVGRSSSVRAWRDLVRLAGATARKRGGFALAGWVDLLKNEGYQILTDVDTVAARIESEKAARDRYISQLVRRASILDLRPLGAKLPPLLIKDVDAQITAVAPGQDQRDGQDLLWAFLRRGRMVLSGLPGSGKSVAISIAAARLLQVPNGPMPIVASLREIDRRDSSEGFRDRLLDVAVRDLPGSDRAILRRHLESLLETGKAALLLDSLDETHSRRGQVMRELHDFIGGISRDVNILLSTRDVAYAQAATLGWPEMRLSAPKNIGGSIQAILSAAAAFNQQSDAEHWVHTRIDWVDAVLDRDSTLRQTPLLPVLLTLLAAEKVDGALPRHRANILDAIVKNIVERRESQRDEEFRVGELSRDSAASAALCGFAVEAAEVASGGGHCTLSRAIAAIREMLSERWDLSAGRAEVTAEAIARFWDEAGIFTISGAEELVAPRLELYAEIGEAVYAIRVKPNEICRWVEATLRAGRLDPVILAAGLSSVAAQQLLLTASASGERRLLHAAMTAVREGASVNEAELRTLVGPIIRDIQLGDFEAWRTWSASARLRLPSDLQAILADALSSFPTEYQAIGRSLLILRANPRQLSSADSAQLVDGLRITRLPRLRRRGGNKAPTVVDETFIEVKEGAAKALLGVIEEATPLVIASLKQGSMGMQERMAKLCDQRGFGDLASQIIRERTRRISKIFSPLLQFEQDGHVRMLEYLRSSAHGGVLDYRDEMRLDELADFFESMNLNMLSAWPVINDSQADTFAFLTLVQQLGNFDIRILSAQASMMLERLEVFQEDEVFFALFDQATSRVLDNWDQVPDQRGAVDLLVRFLFRGLGAAQAAAGALGSAPVAEVIPRLRGALADLESSPEHQQVVALALLMASKGREGTKWFKNRNPVLRRIYAENSGVYSTGILLPQMLTLLRDQDGHVVEAAIGRLEGLNLNSETMSELQRIAAGPNPGWMCLSCGATNAAGGVGCRNCHVIGPNPVRVAARRIDKSQ
jgi:hypothetical protein